MTDLRRDTGVNELEKNLEVFVDDTSVEGVGGGKLSSFVYSL